MDQETFPRRQVPGVPLVYEHGKAVADGDSEYDTIQAALDAATDTVIVGPGTYGENLVIDSDNMTLIGSGRGTNVNPSSGQAISVEAADVTVRDLAVQTSDDHGISGDAASASRERLVGVVVIDSGGRGINTQGDDAVCDRCRVISTSSDGIYLSSINSTAENCTVADPDRGEGIAGDAIVADANSCQVNDCRAISFSGWGVNVKTGQDFCQVEGNNIGRPGTGGIKVQGMDAVVSGNTITGVSTSNAYDFSNAESPQLGENMPQIMQGSVSVPLTEVPNGDTLRVFENFDYFFFPQKAGVQNDSGNAPTDLEWRIDTDPHGTGNVIHSGSTKSESISHNANGSDITGDVAFVISNQTGSSQNVSAFFEFHGK